MPSPIPEKILRLARAVDAEGGRALMVGGCVRDRLMGRAVKDWDVEVYGVEPARLRELLDGLGRVNVVGEAFAVYKLGRDLDVSLPRRERKAGRGHRAFVIEGDPSMSVEESTRRRDFTVNAVLEDPLKQEILDPFGGRADLERKILRAVSPETFIEDSLRVLRAAQFAARFEFDVEPETVELCRAIDLTDLPPERVWGELEKLLLRARRPSVGLRWLDRLGVNEKLFPELRALKGVPQDSEWHPEGWDLTAMPPESFVAGVAQPERLVWSFGVATPRADKVVRVMFKIALDNMSAIVRHAVNDFEVVRGVVHPVAVFVMNMLPAFQPTSQHQIHYDAVQAGGSALAPPAGVNITSVVVDARSSAVDGDILFYFDLAVVGDSDFSHGGEGRAPESYFMVEVGDVFHHTCLTLDRARELIDDLDYPRRVTVMLAALCHDFGKPSTTEFIEGRIRSRGHEEAGVRPTETFLDRLRLFTLEGYDVRSQVAALVRDHLKPGEFYRLRDEISDGAFRRLARRCELELLYRVARADSLGRNAPSVPRERWYTADAQEWFIARARELAVGERPPAPLLMGRHLLEMGLKPSPVFKKILDAVYEMQLDNRVRDVEEAKRAAGRLLRGEAPSPTADAGNG